VEEVVHNYPCAVGQSTAAVVVVEVMLTTSDLHFLADPCHDDLILQKMVEKHCHIPYPHYYHYERNWILYHLDDDVAAANSDVDSFGAGGDYLWNGSLVVDTDYFHKTAENHSPDN